MTRAMPLDRTFTDVRVRGDVRSPATVRAFCQLCLRYQTLKITGNGVATRLHCEICDSAERYDPTEAIPI